MALTRAEQDEILCPVVESYRRQHCDDFGYLPSTTGTVGSFRAALRLDDPVLDDLIAQGAHKQPWRSPRQLASR